MTPLNFQPNITGMRSNYLPSRCLTHFIDARWFV